MKPLLDIIRQNKHFEKSKNKKKIYNEIIKYEETIVDKDGLVKFKCSSCDNWFYPRKLDVYSRLYAIEGKVSIGSERRLYCSQECKDNCPVYWKSTWPKGFEYTTPRKDQLQWREMVLENCNYTCQKCGSTETPLIAHHVDPVTNNPVESADVDNGTVLCEECHKWIHRNVPGCGYNELKCSY